MKIPGTEVHIELPPWPKDFDIMGCLHEGVYVRVDTKTGDIEFRVGSATPPERLSNARTREEG